jgi:hypothetical protein
MSDNKVYFENNALIIPNIIWTVSGGAIITKIEEAIFPSGFDYRMKFAKTEEGKLISGKPVRIVFDNSDAITLIKLIGIDF